MSVMTHSESEGTPGFPDSEPLQPLLPGRNGDDFLAVGLRGGRVVYSYNLGSGTASLRSDPLDLSLGIHTIHLGRSFQVGWLKVKSCFFILPADWVLPGYRMCMEVRGEWASLPPPGGSQTSTQNRRPAGDCS